jgi:hypothetical protein
MGGDDFTAKLVKVVAGKKDFQPGGKCLVSAARHGIWPAVRALLEDEVFMKSLGSQMVHKGPAVDAPDAEGWTALYAVADQGCHELVSAPPCLLSPSSR